jgi:hypothetical protein
MANFSVIAKNNKLEQINNIDDLQYAFEMYKYLAYEMDFPDVKLIDNETDELLLYVKKESTTCEYISPLLMKAFQEGEENADTPIEPNEVSEETADLNQLDYAVICREKLEEMFTDTKYPESIVKQLEDIYNKVIAMQYDKGTLKHLLNVLEEIEKRY